MHLLTQCMAVDWVERGIRVNAIAPGYFLSDMTRQFIDANPETGAGLAGACRPDGSASRRTCAGSSCSSPPTPRATSSASRVVIDGGYTLV